MELVACLSRQERLRALELAILTAAAAESPPAEATVRKLLAFARYGARIDKDIGRALQALRVLRNRPDAWIDELRNGTAEPDAPLSRDCTSDLPHGTREPDVRIPHHEDCTNEFLPRTAEPEPPAHNRHERRRLAALARGRRAA